MWCIKCNSFHYIDSCPKDDEPSGNSFLFNSLNLPKFDPPLPDYTPNFTLPKNNFNIFDTLNSFNKKENVYFCIEMFCPGHSTPDGRCLTRGGPGLGLGL